MDDHEKAVQRAMEKVKAQTALAIELFFPALVEESAKREARNRQSAFDDLMKAWDAASDEDRERFLCAPKVVEKLVWDTLAMIESSDVADLQKLQAKAKAARTKAAA